MHTHFNAGITASRQFIACLAITAGLLNISLAHATFETPGQFNVTPTGAASYTIPIAVPPGTAGMAPSLALVYNSQSGNGLLGMGWAIGGLSAISRCGRTLIQDGVLDTVNYNANDKYCLDGQRLVPVAATAPAPAGCTASTEYRTERESFTRINSCGAAGSGPAYFIAKTKSGQTIEFGNTVDSRVEAQGKADVRAWATNKISDSKGNYLTVSYTEDNANGDYRPDRIDYTGNANVSPVLTPYNSVRFVYQARTDITPLYQAGSVSKTMMRLSNVQTYAKAGAADVVVRDYRLVYDSNTVPQRSRLVSLTECDGAASSICLRPTSLNWIVSGSGWVHAPNYKAPANIAADGYGDLGTRQIDLNGDGLPDFLYSRIIPGSNTFLNEAWLNTGSGWVSAPNYKAPANIAADGYGDLGTRQIDLNGDGLPDFLYSRVVSGTYQNEAWLNTGSGWVHAPNYKAPANIAADGYGDLGTRQIDLNGDGLPDFLYSRIIPGSNTFLNEAWLNTGSGWVSAPNYKAPANIAADGYGDLGTRQIDLNGDGLPDFLYSRVVSGTYQNEAWLTKSIKPDLLTSVTTGLGTLTSPTYKPITDNSIYTKDNDAVYPYMDLQAPIYVVSSVTGSDGVGGTRTTNYKYFGAKNHQLGGGFLGFRQFDVTDAATGITTATAFRQDYPFQGLPAAVTQTQANGAVLRSVTNTWDFDIYPGTVIPAKPILSPPPSSYGYGSKHHFAKLGASQDKTYELDGSLVTQVDTTTLYEDGYGNATRISVTSLGGYNKTTVNSYTNDLINWYMGRLTSATVTSTAP